MEFRPLYQTTIINQGGINDKVQISDNSKDILVSDPLSKQEGNNPEQLMGAALATCLNATLEAEEKRRNLPHQSSVEVQVTMTRDYQGFQFLLHAQVNIPHVTLKEAAEMLEIAEKRCPVAKLLQNQENVRINLVRENE